MTNQNPLFRVGSELNCFSRVGRNRVAIRKDSCPIRDIEIQIDWQVRADSLTSGLNPYAPELEIGAQFVRISVCNSIMSMLEKAREGQ